MTNTHNNNKSDSSGFVFSLRSQVLLFMMLVIALFCTLLFFASGSQQKLVRSISNFQSITNQQNLVSALEQDVLNLQRYVLVFKDNGDKSSVEKFHNKLAQINTKLVTLSSDLPSTQNTKRSREIIISMNNTLREYKSNFSLVVKNRYSRDTHFQRGVLDGLNSLLADSGAFISGNSIDEREARNNLRYHLSLAENKAYQYLVEPSENLRSEFLQELSLVKQIAQRSSMNLQNVNAVNTKLEQIQQEFAMLARAIKSYMYLAKVAMNDSANEFLKLASELSSISNHYAETANTTISNTIEHNELSITLYAAFGMILIIVVSIINARRIISPINKITRVFEKLSQDIDIDEFPGAKRKDEIGRLAQAAVVFSEKNAQTRRLLAESRLLNNKQAVLNQQFEDAKTQAENANASKSIFLANMSHEIRTPLNAIVGLVDIALQHELSKQTREHLEKINYSGQILLNVINDILDFSKIEAGKLEIENSYFSFASVFDSLLAVANLKAAEKNLNLRLYVDPELPSNALGDPLRITQVVLNLVNNAIKFTQSGEVNISFKIENFPASSNFLLVVEVQDTGIGMTEEQLSRIFSPFMQADGSTSRKFGGTGLGLSIVSQLTKLMHGSVSAQSKPDMGSTFTCSFTLGHDSEQRLLSESRNKFNQNLYYLSDENRLLIDDTYLAKISAYVKHFTSAEIDNLLATATSKDLVLIDIAHGRQSRNLQTHVQQLKQRGVRIACVTNTRPERLKTILNSQWQCPVISHPFTPIQFDLFANAFFAGDSSFENQSSDSKNGGKLCDNERLSGHVLLVEDNGINQLVAGEMLYSFGLSFDIAEDGQQAVTKVKNSPYYDAILMDIQMPVMDGIEATKQIRELGHTDVPILGLSANAMKVDKNQGMESGMTDYLTKPIRREILRKALKKHLLSQRQTEHNL